VRFAIWVFKGCQDRLLDEAAIFVYIPSMSTAPLLDIRSVSFGYTQQLLIQDMNLRVESGEYIGILGSNGSGKSTLIQLMLGLLQPIAGSIYMRGTPLAKFSEWDTIGYVPQYIQQKNALPATVWEVVASRFHDSFWLNSNQKKQVEEALKRANMVDQKDTPLAYLSGGQLQRTFIARSLVTHPQLLILDEPTSGVDEQSQRDFYEFIDDINKKQFVSIVLVNHNFDIIRQYAQRCIHMEAGSAHRVVDY